MERSEEQEFLATRNAYNNVIDLIKDIALPTSFLVTQ